MEGRFLNWKYFARKKILRESKRVDKRIADIRKGKLKVLLDHTLTSILEEASGRLDSVCRLAEKYGLTEDPDYIRYTSQSKYFFSLLSDEMNQRDKERELYHRPDSEKQEGDKFDELIEALQVDLETTIPVTYNHYNYDERETWRLN
jgi:hypothetical protein